MRHYAPAAIAGLAAFAISAYIQSSAAPEQLKSAEDLAEPVVIIEVAEPMPEPEPASLEEPEQEPVSIFTEYDVELIGRTIWGEAGGVRSMAERAAVAWCILNRVDGRGITIQQAVTARKQFHGYRPAVLWGECPDEHLELARDVLQRWEAEKNGTEDVGRVLPAEYQYFVGDGERNHFTVEYQDGQYWSWTLKSPY